MTATCVPYAKISQTRAINAAQAKRLQRPKRRLGNGTADEGSNVLKRKVNVQSRVPADPILNWKKNNRPRGTPLRVRVNNREGGRKRTPPGALMNTNQLQMHPL